MPYQLHWPPLGDELEGTELDEGSELEEGTELDEGTLLDEGTELDDGADEDEPGVQTLPLTLGISTAPPLVTPWKPNSTVCPG